MDQITKSLGPALTFLVILAILWFSYVILNIIVTFFKARKLDNSLTFCFNKLGMFYYGGLTLLYLITLIGTIFFIARGFIINNMSNVVNAINVLGFMSVLFAWQLSSIVLVGRKNMMVGRMLIDYRKLKKLNFGYNNKVSFVYAQHEYEFSIRFVDVTELRKRISK